jgi:hypothetical protein
VRSTIAVVAIVAVVLAACGSEPTRVVPSVSPSAAASGTAVPIPSSAARELPGDTAELPAGRYARASSVPGVTFEIDGGWSSGPADDAKIELRHAAGDGGLVVTLARIDHASAVSVADGARSTDGITVRATSESRMSGLTGPNVELENPTAADIALLATSTGTIDLGPGQRMWLSLFDTDAGVVAIAVTAAAADWDVALLAAEPFLESVTIGT